MSLHKKISNKQMNRLPSTFVIRQRYFDKIFVTGGVGFVNRATLLK